MTDLDSKLRDLEGRITAGGMDLPPWARNALRAAADLALADERCAIVAWFGSYGLDCDDCSRADTMASAADCEVHSPLDGDYKDIADAIESGAHRALRTRGDGLRARLDAALADHRTAENELDMTLRNLDAACSKIERLEPALHAAMTENERLRLLLRHDHAGDCSALTEPVKCDCPWDAGDRPLGDENDLLRKLVGELVDQLIESDFRLNHYRKVCGCLSMSGVCHRCAKTVEIENQGSAVIARARAAVGTED